MSNAKGSFFNFPLCLLSFGDDVDDRFALIIHHAVMRAGEGSEVCEQRIETYLCGHPKLEKEWDGTDEHQQAIRGAIVCNVKLGSIAEAIRSHNRALSFISKREECDGKNDALVCIGAQLLWGCRADSDPSYRHFSTICAVNSIIGRRTGPVLIRRGMIMARQLGYKTPTVMNANLSERTDGAKPLTVQQLRDALEWLEDRGFISRYQASRRNVYFSKGSDYEALKAAVLAMKVRKSISKQQRESERRLTSVGNPAPSRRTT